MTTNNQHQQKILQQGQAQQMYKQFYQCKCKQTFHNFDQYLHHIQNQNHHIDQSHNQQQYPIIEQKNQMIQDQHIVKEIQMPNQVSEKVIIQNEQYSNGNYEKQIGNDKNEFTGVPFINKANQFDYRHNRQRPYQNQYVPDIEIEQKHQSFKYIQTYYQSKLAPFYRQFDIDPQRSVLNSKKTHENKDRGSFLSSNLKFKQNKLRFSRQNATRDLNKVLQEVGVRMIPVQNGIIDFIDSFTAEKIHQIRLMTNEDILKIQKNLQENLSELGLFCFNNKKQQKKTDLFMDLEIDFIMRTFIDFLKETLRPNDLWIGYLMLIPITEGVIKYFVENNEFIDSGLKLIDFPLMMNSIKFDEFKINLQIPIQVKSENVTQFLIWFTQWFSMVQLVKSKWSIEYIEPLYEQVHFINNLYRENVNKYKKYVVAKQIQYARIYKKKIIQKQRMKEKFQQEKRQRQLKEFKRFDNKSHLNQIIGDFNLQNSNKIEKKSFHDDQFNVKLRINEQASSNVKKNEKSWVQTSKPELSLNQRNNISKQNPQTIPVNQQIQSNFTNQVNLKGISQKRHLNLKDNANFIQSQHLNQQNYSINDSQRDDFEDEQMKQAYISAFKSQYVSYFSPQFAQARKKEQQKWTIKASKLVEIIKNPHKWKATMSEEIQNQLLEVNRLTGTGKVDYDVYQYLLNRMKQKSFRPFQFDYNQEFMLAFQQHNATNQNGKRYDASGDPFVIHKNYRYRNNFYRNLNKMDSMERSQFQQSQYDVIEQQRSQIKSDSAKKASNNVKQSKNTKRQKYNQQNKQQINEKNQVSNDFLDQFL